ncbi:hypothetical protein QFZ82_000358 [Streptomyces sp. V4I23]|nr:hypothetical protein [Streptomyces sp. V4I23]
MIHKSIEVHSHALRGLPRTGDPEWDHVIDEIQHPETTKAFYLLALCCHPTNGECASDRSEGLARSEARPDFAGDPGACGPHMADTVSSGTEPGGGGPAAEEYPADSTTDGADGTS